MCIRDRIGSETTVLVTTDHGRARSIRGHGAAFPESQRVFAAAFGAGVARHGVTCTSEPLRLAHVAGAVRSILGVRRLAGVSGAEPPTLSDERSPLAAQILE